MRDHPTPWGVKPRHVVPAPFAVPGVATAGKRVLPPSPGLLVLYLPYGVVTCIRHIEIAG